MAKKHLTQENLNALVAEAMAIEAEEAKEAGAIGFMARALTQATMPHSKPDGNEFTRSNGAFTLSILAPAKVGLPYGAIPRLLISWITTEAVRTKERELILGENLSDFMGQLGLVPTGGRWGSIARIKCQSKRLFSATINCTYESEGCEAIRNVNIASKALLWWDKPKENEAAWQSTVTLTEDFFTEITSRPIPVDMRALKALKQSPMALDIYCWLTYRLSYLKKETTIPWAALQMQFGADYGRTRDFKSAFAGHLKSLSVVYPEAQFKVEDDGLHLSPSPPHVMMLPR